VKIALSLLAFALAAVAQQPGPSAREIQKRITANGLRADVSFLASDALEGRRTPSRGLNIAGEYIAAQFRRAGLEPAGDDGYFQNATVRYRVKGVARTAAGRNVAGILRGSDAALKDTYLVISAHYDHLGARATGTGDRIYNGANDDASGTAAMIAIANALSALPVRPRRSIVFLALFAEEVGGVGSRYYVEHPAFPIAKTVADINLEQLGRTDSDNGAHLRQFNLTGYEFTTLADVLRAASEEIGVQALNDDENGDRFFGCSDNVRFAAAGVPSTTASVTYMFPDYHGVGDEWSKLDYDNMAQVAAALALGAWRLADSETAPQWKRDPASVLTCLGPKK
jgi:Zn-dependent M28 family amino/carboxypeptidase